MNKYEEIYEKYKSDEFDDKEILEDILAHVDPEAARFWALLKGLQFWGGTKDLREMFLAEINEFFKK